MPARALGRRRRPREAYLEASRAYIRLTEVFWFANDVPALVHAGIRALNLAERAGPSPELARAYAIMCLSAGSIPIQPLARMYGRRAHETARTAGQLWPLAYVRFITSVYNMGAAHWEEVREALAEAEGLFERLGDRRLLGDTWSVQAMLALYRGQFAAADALSAKLYDYGVRNENVQHQVWAAMSRAECALQAGRSDEAADLLDTALALLAEHPNRAEQLQAHGRLAVVRLRQGQETAAKAAADSAASLIAQLRRPTSFYLLEGYAGVAEVYLRRWGAGDQSSATKRTARQACSALRTFAHVFPMGEPRARLMRGLLHHVSGRPRRARAAWRASLSAAERLGMPFEAALAHAELGRHARSEPLAQQHLERARALLGELGLPHEPTSSPDPAAR